MAPSLAEWLSISHLGAEGSSVNQEHVQPPLGSPTGQERVSAHPAPAPSRYADIPWETRQELLQTTSVITCVPLGRATSSLMPLNPVSNTTQYLNTSSVRAAPVVVRLAKLRSRLC